MIVRSANICAGALVAASLGGAWIALAKLASANPGAEQWAVSSMLGMVAACLALGVGLGTHTR